MTAQPTISDLSRATGIHRIAIAAVIDTNEVETVDVGPSRMVTAEGMKRLAPLLQKLKKRKARRRREPATA